jgi:hypothetical protein
MPLRTQVDSANVRSHSFAGLAAAGPQAVSEHATGIHAGALARPPNVMSATHSTLPERGRVEPCMACGPHCSLHCLLDPLSITALLVNPAEFCAAAEPCGVRCALCLLLNPVLVLNPAEPYAPPGVPTFTFPCTSARLSSLGQAGTLYSEAHSGVRTRLGGW